MASHPRRGNFNKMSCWPHAVRAIGMEGLHFHDLRHAGNYFAAASAGNYFAAASAGNYFAAASGAGLKELMARMGHDSERAALIYQRQARGADKRITDAIDFRVQAERGQATMTAAPLGRRCPPVNGTLMARKTDYDSRAVRPGRNTAPLTWVFAMERVTGIEPALSAWEVCDVVRLPPADSLTCGLLIACP